MNWLFLWVMGYITCLCYLYPWLYDRLTAHESGLDVYASILAAVLGVLLSIVWPLPLTAWTVYKVTELVKESESHGDD